MAKIYRVPQGVKTRGKDRLNYVVAHHAETALELEVHADAVFGRATANLAEHRNTGAAKILHEKGDVDHYIILEDDAALSIEFGTEHIEDPPAPLTRAIRVV